MKPQTKTAQHTHEYKRSKPSATVETCACGKWKHTENAGPSIVEQRAQHTPGPWKFISDYKSIAGVRPDNSGLPLCVVQLNVPLHGEIDGYEMMQANARLIAAAPELLEAGKFIAQEINDALKPGSPHTFMTLVAVMRNLERRMSAAIAKAEGGK